jgi:predicted nucleic acid-binding Zn ribbon protein
MPIYEYQCEKCGNVFSKFQQISEEPLSQCTVLIDAFYDDKGSSTYLHCNGKLTKLISVPQEPKGSGPGWYGRG